MTPEQQKAHEALSFIIPILDKLNLRWCITGGFACYAYGVPRNLTDIDIDIEVSKDDPAFTEFLLKVLGGSAIASKTRAENASARSSCFSTPKCTIC